MSLYGLARVVFGPLLALRVRVRAEGLEHVPERGPFLLIPNHRSFLDPVFIQAACPRVVHTMTKSSQFKGLWRPLLVALKAFPTRRYRIDPQAVRTVLHLLEQGRGVCIYPEGERSWDGRLRPFRRGSMRLVLKAGVPVVPCGITGSYELLPRWSRRLVRGAVTVRFGETIHFGPHDRREDRERALRGATRQIRDAVQAQMEPSGPDTDVETP